MTDVVQRGKAFFFLKEFKTWEKVKILILIFYPFTPEFFQQPYISKSFFLVPLYNTGRAFHFENVMGKGE